ncbi:MAG: hypothetical protein AAF063_16865 [Cyanobacteria bacterium J06643_5]
MMIEITEENLNLITEATQCAKDFLPEYDIFHVKNIDYEQKEENIITDKTKYHRHLELWTVYMECGHGNIEVDCWRENKENVLYCDVTLW